jgi:hypothetical protein
VQNDVFLSSDNNLGTIRIRMDRKSVLYYRYIENIFELLEKVGGFKEAVFPLIMLLAYYW